MQGRKLSFVFSLAAVAVAWLCMVPSAMAGRTSVAPVNITVNGDIVAVSGSFADTRNDATTTDFIFCAIDSVKGQAPYAWCNAYQASTNEFAFCEAFDPAELQAIASLNGDSSVYFKYSTTDYECTEITSYKGSFLSPKTK